MLKRPTRSRIPRGVLPRSAADVDPTREALYKKIAEDVFECMARHIADRLEMFRISLKAKGKSLDNEQWLLFLQELRRAEHRFAESYWDKLEPRLQHQITRDPLFTSIQENQGKWPEDLKPSENRRSNKKSPPRGDIARN